MRITHPPRRRFRAFPAAALALVLILSATTGWTQAPAKYHSYADLTAALQTLVKGHADVARLESIGKTLGGRDIWAVEIAGRSGAPVKDRPGLLIAASFEGDHIAGGEIALAVAEGLLRGYPAHAQIKARLDETVVYILPRVNPDGIEGMFAPLRTGRRTNAAPRDDDNDGRVDEDGPEDLNKDGLVTVMRVKDPAGEYMVDPEEPRLMKKADPKKGEAGVYKLSWEGVDNDGDGFVNEDPAGGVDINRNFAHQYPYYAPDAGLHMVSERETRAVMDWVLAHRNIAAVLTFGWSDNLIVAPTAAGRTGPARGIDLTRFAEASIAGARTIGMIQTGDPFGGRFGRGGGFEMMMRRPSAAPTEAAGRMRMPDRRPAVTIDAADVEYFRAIAEEYGELTGIRQPLFVREPEGAFFQYGYYQFGVPSFSTPGFGLTQAEPGTRGRMGGPGAAGGPPAGEPAGRATRSGEAAGGQAAQRMMPMMGGAGGARGFAQAMGGQAPGEAAAAPGIDKQVLKWLDDRKADGFAAWTPVKHPELGEVEVGGFKPYALNPLPAEIAALGESHLEFALHLASLLPRVKIASTEATGHGGGLFRIKAVIENAGFLPTALAHAVAARAVRPTMVRLDVKPEDIVSGAAKTSFIQALDGSGRRAAYEWLVRGKAGQTVELRVVSQKGGADKARIVLK